MRIVLVGANGTIGKHVYQSLGKAGHEIVRIGRRSGDFQLRMESPEEVARTYKKIGQFDAVVSTAGEVTFAPLLNVKPEEWAFSFQSKLTGQISLVQQGVPYMNAGGSFTLISGILGDEQILAGTVAATVNYALSGFVKSAACELPKGLRINLVSPTLLEDSLNTYGAYFPGFIPVSGERVAQAFIKSVMGVQTGQIYRVN